MGADSVSRQELYEMVWSTPMIKVAERFKVSGSYMARVCSALRVPRPERGYWAKLAFGKATEKPSLPVSEPGDPLSWSRDGALPVLPRLRLATAAAGPRRGKLPRPVTGIHRLVRDAKQFYGTGYKVEEGPASPAVQEAAGRRYFIDGWTR
jgi:hypothetical protein